MYLCFMYCTEYIRLRLNFVFVCTYNIYIQICMNCFSHIFAMFPSENYAYHKGLLLAKGFNLEKGLDEAAQEELLRLYAELRKFIHVHVFV